MSATVASLAGGLGLFLYGMRVMCDALRQVAGARLRKILSLLTRRTVLAVLVGAATTAAVQSSSAMTVMVVGFVNAGLLSLRQAIGTVMGANIGTTATAWIISLVGKFSIGAIALPAVALGCVFALPKGKRNRRLWGQVVLGFGLLFLGLSVLSDAVGPYRESEALRDFFATFARNPLLGVLAGVVVTMMMQSSSATIGLVLVLAKGGLMTLDAAIPVVLGDNIGTTITAQLAAIGAGRPARRTAMAHTIFNVIGAAYILPLVVLGYYGRLVQALVPGSLSTGNVMWHIAVAHSLFNVVNTAVFLPMVGALERLCYLVLPRRPAEADMAPQYLEPHLLETPALAMEQAKREIVRMAQMARQAVVEGEEGFFDGSPAHFSRHEELEHVVDALQSEITAYLGDIAGRNLSEDESDTLPVLIHTVNDIERVSDHGENIAELGERRVGSKLRLSEQARGELKEMCSLVDGMMTDVTLAFAGGDRALAQRVLETEERLNEMQVRLRESHLDRARGRRCHLMAGVLFIDVVDNLEKIGDHLANIAQAVVRGLRWEVKTHERREAEEPA